MNISVIIYLFIPSVQNDQMMETDVDPRDLVSVKVDSVRELCRLRDSTELNRILIALREFAKAPRPCSEMIGNVESDPEYQLIVQANSVAVEIDNEIGEWQLGRNQGHHLLLKIQSPFSPHPSLCQGQVQKTLP